VVVAVVIAFVLLASPWDSRPSRQQQPALSDLFDDSKFVLVPHGKFWMSRDGKNAQRVVEIPHDFYLGKYLVTQEQWQAVMGNNPSYFSRTGGGAANVEDISDTELKQFPVENVSWADLQEFLIKLNIFEKNSGWLYRLPTEAEWEYACRGGATSKAECSFDYYFDKLTNDLSSDQANFRTTLGRNSKVGSYPPNKLGLYDMHGNVWQWCQDADEGGSDRVVRGGSWYYLGSGCHAAARGRIAPSDRSRGLGFRLVRVPSGK
jgi:formylglycine-generating enzyme required for sulfatase activity